MSVSATRSQGAHRVHVGTARSRRGSSYCRRAQAATRDSFDNRELGRAHSLRDGARTVSAILVAVITAVESVSRAPWAASAGHPERRADSRDCRARVGTDARAVDAHAMVVCGVVRHGPVLRALGLLDRLDPVVRCSQQQAQHRSLLCASRVSDDPALRVRPVRAVAHREARVAAPNDLARVCLPHAVPALEHELHRDALRVVALRRGALLLGRTVATRVASQTAIASRSPRHTRRTVGVCARHSPRDLLGREADASPLAAA